MSSLDDEDQAKQVDAFRKEKLIDELESQCRVEKSTIHIEFNRDECIIIIKKKPPFEYDEFLTNVDVEFLKFRLPEICIGIECKFIFFEHFFKPGVPKYSSLNNSKQTNDDLFVEIITELISNGKVDKFMVPGLILSEKHKDHINKLNEAIEVD